MYDLTEQDGVLFLIKKEYSWKGFVTVAEFYGRSEDVREEAYRMVQVLNNPSPDALLPSNAPQQVWGSVGDSHPRVVSSRAGRNLPPIPEPSGPPEDW